MSIRRSSTAWGAEDGRAMECILSGVTDQGVPRIREALTLLSGVLNPTDEGLVVALEPDDAVLTDAIRCVLCHRWLVPSVKKSDAAGNAVQAFFTQPYNEAQILSLFSSTKTFEKVLRQAASAGVRLLPVSLTFAQIMLAHLPNMTLEAVKKMNGPEKQALGFLALDPEPFLDDVPEGSQASMDSLIIFDERVFPLLQNLSLYYALAGDVLEVQADLASGAGKVAPNKWNAVLCSQPLHIIRVDESIFASEAGTLLFCYPGDASKVLSYQRRKGTLCPVKGKGKVAPVEPANLVTLLRMLAGMGSTVLILASVFEEEAELNLHGLTITPQIFADSVEPAMMPVAD